MGVKNNFSQAVSELIGISRNVEPEQKKEEVHNEEVLEAEAAPEGAEEGAVFQDAADAGTDSELTAEQEETPLPQNPKEKIMAMLAAQQAHQQASQPQEEDTRQPREVQQPPSEVGLTTIAKGTVIIGEINADGDVELLGSVKGKVASQGDIKANGKVIGDLIGKDIELISCAVQGNIIASGLVTVDGESVVIGDVKGENFCLDGKIKGNVTIEKEAKFQPKAILAGNVTTASIAMSQGAKIQGEVNIPLGEKDADMPFEIDMMM